MRIPVALLLIVFTSFAALGEEKKLDLKPSWHPMVTGEPAHQIETKESVVEVNGQRYRRIEYKNDAFYVKLQGADSTAPDDDLQCERLDRRTQPAKLVEVSAIMTKRTRLFIDGLSKRCSENELRSRGLVSLDPSFGIAIKPKTKDGHEKKIFVDPFINGGGFSSEW